VKLFNLAHANARPYLEELANVVEHHPLGAGDTLSHETARFCAERGWIVRQEDGKWIPTEQGLRVAASESLEGGGLGQP
jgi:hypothetical protein